MTNQTKLNISVSVRELAAFLYARTEHDHATGPYTVGVECRKLATRMLAAEAMYEALTCSELTFASMERTRAAGVSLDIYKGIYLVLGITKAALALAEGKETGVDHA